jgi:hypothetical protein
MSFMCVDPRKPGRLDDPSDPTVRCQVGIHRSPTDLAMGCSGYGRQERIREGYFFTDQFTCAASGITTTNSPARRPARTAASELYASEKAAPG